MAASRGSALRPGSVGVQGRWFRFDYDLASGQWSLRTGAGEECWCLASSARVDLIDPSGQSHRRDAGGAAFVACQRTTDDRNDEIIEVRRAWPDGLTAQQRFRFPAGGLDLRVELALRAPVGFGWALRSLSPLSRIRAHRYNLTSQLSEPAAFRTEPSSSASTGAGRPESARQRQQDTEPSWQRAEAEGPNRGSAGLQWRLLDLGWTATEPARVRTLDPGMGVTATGLAALAQEPGGYRLTLGFLDGSRAVGQFAVERGQSAWMAGVEATAWFEAVDLRPGDELSEALWLGFGPIDAALTRFTDAWSRLHSGRPRLTPLVQWLPFATDQALPTAQAVLERVASAAERLRGTSVDVVTVGQGWEQAIGDWQPAGHRYPEGMRALRDAIHAQGLRTGLTVSPLLVDGGSATYQHHPTWVVRASDEQPVVATIDEHESFVLDASQPAVVSWLSALGSRLRQDWGFDLVQLAGLSASTVSGWRLNRAETPVEATRGALRAMVSGLGDCLTVAGQAPLFAVLDLVKAVLTTSAPLRRADPSALLRAFLSGCGVLTGPGPLSVDSPGQTLDEARAAATIACLGGGIVTLAGDLGALPDSRLHILRVCLPPWHDHPVLPIDASGPAGPYLFGRRIQRDWGDCFLAVVLNPDEAPAARVVPLSLLGLPSGCYHAFEFWTQTYLGSVTERLTLDHLPAGGCAVVALRTVRDAPQVVGTSLHVSMDAIVLQEVAFDAEGSRLKLALGAGGPRRGTVTIAMPPGWLAGPVRGTGGSFGCRQIGDRLARVELQFTDVADVEVEFTPPRR